MNPVDLVNKLLQDGTTVQASTEVNGKKCYSQLKAKNGDIHLPALSSSRRTFTVSSLLKHYTNSDIYLTLASDGKELGTIYIKLRNTKSKEYILKQSIGVIDPFIKGAVFNYDIRWPHKATVDIKDYDSKTMDTIDSAYPFPEVSRDSTGLVYTMGSSGLGFVLSVTHDFYMTIGDVVKGMDVLQKACTYENGKVKIDDVGIVLK